MDDPERANEYLDCHASLADPLLMADMAAARDRIAQALECGERMAVFGDYDVDGVTATCLLTDFLRKRGADCQTYIPGRLGEGYGLNQAAVRLLAGQGVTLIVTVDCGITAVKEAALCRALGVPVGFDTDVNAAALGEAVWGCTQSVKNSIYITVGTGVGVGVIIDGKPYHGMMHPEGGHIFVHRRPDDPMAKGICPYHGNCLEGLASGPAIERRWGRKGVELSDCLAVWELEAYYIGQAICTYICTLSPERIVVGGGVMHQEQMLPLIRREVRRQMHGYIQGKGMDQLEEYIVPVSLGDNQGVMGGVKLAMDAYTEAGGTL